MAANGYVCRVGALGMLEWITGRSTQLEAEWAAKAAEGDPLPKTGYLMLLTKTLTETQSATMTELLAAEVTGTGYVRQAVAWAPAEALAPENRRVLPNQDLIQFGPFSNVGGIGSVAAAALVTRQVSVPADPAKSGFPLMLWNLLAAQPTQQNQALQILPRTLTMELSYL